MTPEALIIQSMFRIPNKEGEEVDFILNPAQLAVDEGVCGRDLVPKARQMGISTYYLARNLAKCLNPSAPNQKCVFIAHDAESTAKNFSKVHFMIENMKGAKPRISTHRRNEIRFDKTGSHFYIGTAGSRQFGRGDTINSLHCSEVAFWENAKDQLAGLFQAVPMSGEISIESTGNGKGNWYHRQCMRAYANSGRYKCHFLPWTMFPEYDLSVSSEEARRILSSLDPVFEEVGLAKVLTPGQLKFRRIKLEELDYDLSKFRQEYPMTIDECFQDSGSSLFSKINYVQTPDWQKLELNLHGLMEHWVSPRGRYIMGIDPSGGVGQDDAVIQIFEITTMEQVAEFVSDKTDPEHLGAIAARLGRHYNLAYLVPETNNHGAVTVRYLEKTYPSHLLHQRKGESDARWFYGVQTNLKTKPLIVNSLRRAAMADMTIHSPLLVDEMGTFIETETGRLEAASGCKDDAVIAAALCSYTRQSGLLMLDVQARMSEPAPSPKPEDNPFTLDGILAEMHKKSAAAKNSRYIW